MSQNDYLEDEEFDDETCCFESGGECRCQAYFEDMERELKTAFMVKIR